MMSLSVSDVILTRNFSASGPLLVLIPGWAGLGAHLLATCPYLGPTVALAYTDSETLTQLIVFLHEYDQFELIIMAFSYGAFISLPAFDVFHSRIMRYYLVGICSHYSSRKLQFIRSKLQANDQQYLKQFYQAAMTKNHFGKFSQYGFNDVISFFSDVYLLQTLDHLGKLVINESVLTPYSITFIHGQFDRIASLQSVQQLADASKSQLYWISDSGHFPFYSSLFWDVFDL